MCCGAVEVDEGTLVLSGGSSTNVITIASGVALDFASSYTLADGSLLTGAWVSVTGSLDVFGVYSVATTGVTGTFNANAGPAASITTATLDLAGTRGGTVCSPSAPS